MPRGNSYQSRSARGDRQFEVNYSVLVRTFQDGTSVNLE